MWNDRKSADGHGRRTVEPGAVGRRTVEPGAVGYGRRTVEPGAVGDGRRTVEPGAVGNHLGSAVGNNRTSVVCVPSVEKTFHQIGVVCYFLSPRGRC